MNKQEFAAALRSRKNVYGTAIISESPRWPSFIKKCGLDFVFIDTEHIALDRVPVAWMCAAYGALGIAPIVRIASPDPHEATQVLDAGAAGVIAPYIETVEQVREMHGAVKLRPIKGKRLHDVLHAGACFEPALLEYQRENYGDNMLIINVESAPAIENLDALLDVEGLDGVLIGPHDLTCSLGIPEQWDARLFDDTVRDIGRRARAKGVTAGIHSWMGVDREAGWAKEGINMLIHDSDTIAMSRSLTADIKALRSALGDSPSGPAGKEEYI